MAKAIQPTVTTDEIFFELDRFELEEGERLTLRGRWFGVRGRRFVRPTLSISLDGERLRALADLEHKPWAAEDGQRWEASFPWTRDVDVSEAELSVAPDITIDLPAPGGRTRRARRLPAQPRREAMSASWGEFTSALIGGGTGDPEVVPVESASGAAAADRPLVAEHAAVAEASGPPLGEQLDALRAEVEQRREELESSRGELAAVSSKLASATRELEARDEALTGVRAELEDAQAALGATERERDARERRLEAVQADLATATADRDAAINDAAGAAAERDAATARLESLTAELQRTRAAQAGAQAELERSTRERNDAISARGAALVMRGAARAEPHQRHAGWMTRGLVLFVLAGALVAALIVLHVL